jgi:predicted transcriptional regulator
MWKSVKSENSNIIQIMECYQEIVCAECSSNRVKNTKISVLVNVVSISFNKNIIFSVIHYRYLLNANKQRLLQDIGPHQYN